MIRPFLSAFACAIVLAIIPTSVQHRLQKRFARPSLSALATCLIFILAVLLPGLALAFRVLDEAEPLLRDLQEAAASGRLLRWLMLSGAQGQSISGSGITPDFRKQRSSPLSDRPSGNSTLS